jgi:hypothetical protein
LYPAREKWLRIIAQYDDFYNGDLRSLTGVDLGRRDARPRSIGPVNWATRSPNPVIFDHHGINQR